MASRFRYKKRNSRSGFVELAPEFVPKPKELYEWLGKCHLVERVGWQTTKTSQGNIGEHASEQNIKVFPKGQRAGSATRESLEFEVTRNAHMSENAPCPYTVTVMFKDPHHELFPHAWAILRDVCSGKELFPDKVDEWMKEVLKNYTGQEQEDVQEEEEPAPGSASAEPRRKRTLNDASAEEEEGEEKPPARLGEFIEPPTGADEVKKESTDAQGLVVRLETPLD